MVYGFKQTYFHFKISITYVLKIKLKKISQGKNKTKRITN
jgi:hypothetical protein